MFFKLAAAFAGDDLDERDPFVDSFLNNIREAAVNITAFVENLMKIEDEFGHGIRKKERSF